MESIIYLNHLWEEEDEKISNNKASVVNDCWDLLAIWQLKYIVNDLSFVSMPSARESNYKSSEKDEERRKGTEKKS